jgi:hypothetical protein
MTTKEILQETDNLNTQIWWKNAFLEISKINIALYKLGELSDEEKELKQRPSGAIPEEFLELQTKCMSQNFRLIKLFPTTKKLDIPHSTIEKIDAFIM